MVARATVNPRLDAALDYAERLGWRVVLNNGAPGGVCTCGDPKCSKPGKHPISRVHSHGIKDATNDPAVIRDAFRSFPYANVGVATGAASGFDVLDVDGAEGAATLEGLEVELGPLPVTLTAATGGGGRHYLFRHRPGLGNAVGFAPRLDIRTDGGQIIVDPSVHASGKSYLWIDGGPEEVHAADWPETWFAYIEARCNGRAKSTATATVVGGNGKVPEGQRNSWMTSRAGSLRRIGLEPDAILATLHVENRTRLAAPLPDAELEGIARSIGAKPDGDTEAMLRALDRARKLLEAGNIGAAHAVVLEAARDMAPLAPGASYLDLFVPVAELIDPKATKVEAIVPDFVWPGKVSLTVGREKAGKTTFLYAKIGEMERGGTFLGRPCKATRAVILSEEPRAIIEERCRRFGIKEAVVLPRDRVYRIPTWDEKIQAAVEAADKFSCGYALVDPASKVAGLGPKDENDPGTINPLFATVEQHMGQLAVELNHHAARAEGRTGMDSARGTTAWTQNPDTIITVSKPKKRSNIRTIEWDGREMRYPDPIRVALNHDPATRLDRYTVLEGEVDPGAGPGAEPYEAGIREAAARLKGMGEERATKTRLAGMVRGKRQAVLDAIPSFALPGGFLRFRPEDDTYELL